MDNNINAEQKSVQTLIKENSAELMLFSVLSFIVGMVVGTFVSFYCIITF